MDAQLRGLDGRLEKSLAAQRELEHRHKQITMELDKGWEPAGKYQELKLRLDALNQALAESGAEIEASPELSNLDDEALRPVEPGVGFHQILSLTEDSVTATQEEATSADEPHPPSSESSTINFVQETSGNASEIRLAQGDGTIDQADSGFEAGSEPANGLAVAPPIARSIESDDAQAQKSKAAKRGSGSRIVTTGLSEQMSFDWS